MLLDSAFWIALFDSTDRYHLAANSIHKRIETGYALVPWPTLYEFVNTRWAKSPSSVARVSSELRSPGVVMIDDTKYRDQALSDCLDGANRRPLSLVDRILRAMTTDVGIKLNGVVSFNRGDFEDVCKERGVDLVADDVNAK